MSFIAPAGTPIPLSTYGLALLQGLTRPGVSAQLAAALAAHSGHSRCWLMSTGRAAMVLTLAAMRDVAGDGKRDQVIVPAYTCYSVPASVIKAGLTPRLCDVDPRTLSMNLESLARFDFSRVLAIVTANLYGIPNDLTAIERIARDAGVMMLDDAAQALGAGHRGRPVGGFGDAGLYSFDKGKNITSLEGGAIVASNPALAAAIDRRHAQLEAVPALETTTRVVKLAAYSLLLQPRLYGLVHKLPFLGLGRTLYDETYPLQKYSRVLAGFALRLFGKLPALSASRRSNAQRLSVALQSLPGIQLMQPAADSLPAFTRLPLLVADPTKRAVVLEKLQQAGIGATASYPSALNDVPEVASKLPATDLDMPGARQVAAGIVTLPTHPYCPGDMDQSVRETLRPLLG